MAKPAKTSKLVKPVVYRHTTHAEWGLGVIVEENPSKVYLTFEDGGRRPFVNVARFRDLLVPVELAAEAMEETLAKIAKNAPKPVAAKTAKKPKKKAVEEEEEEVVVEEPERDDDEEEDG